ncbi:MAG TPA: hypothetical protein VGE94_02945, partial [Chloroflexota bacterium]
MLPGDHRSDELADEVEGAEDVEVEHAPPVLAGTVEDAAGTVEDVAALCGGSRSRCRSAALSTSTSTGPNR